MQDCQQMVNTNILGVMAMTQLIVPGMVQRGGGHVFMMSSIAAHEAYSGGAIYCATKHAVQAYTDSLRHDLIATPVRHSTLCLCTEHHRYQCSYSVNSQSSDLSSCMYQSYC